MLRGGHHCGLPGPRTLPRNHLLGRCAKSLDARSQLLPAASSCGGSSHASDLTKRRRHNVRRNGRRQGCQAKRGGHATTPPGSGRRAACRPPGAQKGVASREGAYSARAAAPHLGRPGVACGVALASGAAALARGVGIVISRRAPARMVVELPTSYVEASTIGSSNWLESRTTKRTSSPSGEPVDSGATNTSAMTTSPASSSASYRPRQRKRIAATDRSQRRAPCSTAPRTFCTE